MPCQPAGEAGNSFILFVFWKKWIIRGPLKWNRFIDYRYNNRFFVILLPVFCLRIIVFLPTWFSLIRPKPIQIRNILSGFLNMMRYFTFSSIIKDGSIGISEGQNILIFWFIAGFVLFLCLSKEKERKRKDTKIKDQDTHIPHKPALHKMFCKRKFEKICLIERTF